jgi:HEPN domain-containing protein
LQTSKFRPPEEWFIQAEYDIGTAEAMYDTGRYIYCIFMCHLSIEKALKGLYAKTFLKDPEKTHNLNYLIDKIQTDVPEDMRKFIDN